jgi:hypothetical protein
MKIKIVAYFSFPIHLKTYRENLETRQCIITWLQELNIVGEFRKTRHPRNIEFNKVLEICFSGAGHSQFSGILDPRSLRFANMRFSGILNRRRLGVMNTREPGTSNGQSHELRRIANSGICRESGSEVTRGEIREPEKKQSQSCRPKKSGFRVWTSGRIVNVWDEKDILVCVHIRNILWDRGRFRNVKVPSSPYKRGREGTCKWIQTFGTCAIARGTHCLLSFWYCVWTC